MVPEPGADEARPALARALASLGNGKRLSILAQLRSPKTLREIEVRAGSDEAFERTLSRQTVREHLDRLLEIGVIHARETDRDYGPTVEYSLNHQALFALSEEFRALARLRPVEEPEAETAHRREAPRALEMRGPCLVLVKGLDEGRTFDLRPPGRGRASWLVGRSRGLAIALDFDPFVSAENAEVLWEDSRYFVRDLPESRNGTTVNFAPIRGEGRRPLATGDLIGVGRTLLMFRA